jgi:hypothetical protein
VLNKILLKINPGWGFDQNEIRWTKSLPATKKFDPAQACVCVQSPQNHYVLALWFAATSTARANNINLIALDPTIFSLKQRRDILFPFRLGYSLMNDFFRKKKWHRLYRTLGVSSQIRVNEIPFARKFGMMKNAWRIWRSLKSKEDLLNLHIKGYYCGDLIYDTYLRYRVQATVNVSSVSVLYFIYETNCTIEACERLVERNKIQDYFTSYTTYIQHGIPVRVFLKHNVNVYAAGNLQQRLKKLTLDDYYQTATHKNYLKTFNTLSEKSERIAIGKSMLQNKFKGAIDQSTSYMKSSAFNPSGGQPKEALKFDGVIFLHDFYDSPHIYSSLLFPDFYEWVEFTFKIVLKHKLNVGVKPHPNQTKESSRDIEYLKRKYPSIQWMNPNVSNAHILNSEIKFGVSVYGTVLHELAYHGVIPICAGDNPHAAFNFVFFPKSQEEYENMILNYQKLTLPPDYQDQVATFYYMHNAFPKDQVNFDDSRLIGHSIIDDSSEVLREVLS